MKWAPIPGYDRYQASECGKIKNGDRILKPTIGTDKYYVISLSNGMNKKQFRVHRLIAMVFIQNPDSLPVVNHIDGNKLNNHAGNLEWCTVDHNLSHAIQTGLFNFKGMKNPKCKITDDIVIKIRTLYEAGVKQKMLSSMFGLKMSNIDKIVKRRSWQHINHSRVSTPDTQV